jgi:large subunit ribosomal protein L10
MAKTRKQKAEIISDLKDKLTRAKSVVFAEISGYTMADANQLREKARKDALDIGVVKKTLVEIASKEAGVPLEDDTLTGSTLAVFGYGDEIAPARVMAAFVKGRELMHLTAGIIGGKLISSDEVKKYASLPSRDELLAKVVGSLNAPVSGFVNVLAGNLRGLVCALNAIKETKN